MITNFIDFRDCLAEAREHVRQHKYKVTCHLGMTHFVTSCQQTGHVFQIALQDAYNSVMNYDEPARKLFLPILENSSSHHDAVMSAMNAHAINA